MANRSSTSLSSTTANAGSGDESQQDKIASNQVEGLATDLDLSEDYDELCDLCGSLNIEYLVSDHGGEGKLYDLDALVNAASRCKTCEKIFNPRGFSDGTGRQYSRNISVSFNIRPRVGGCCGILLIRAFEAADSCRSIMTCKLHLADHTVFTNEGDVASSKYGLLPLRTVGTNTSSAESFNIAQKWLRSCIEGHQGNHNLRAKSFRNSFGESNLEEGVGPARVIDVFAHRLDARSKGSGSKGTSAPDFSDPPGDEYLHGQKKLSRIVDRVDVLGPYLALSYMWGTHPYKGYITTNANLPARKRNIVEHELPKTFQHAIHIARSLGVRYLWIDAVCIIQDSDDAKDWLQESKKMGSIFANALLTLVAAAGKNSKEGMFNKRSITYGEEVGSHPFALHTFSPGSDVRSTLHFVRSSMDFNPIHTRSHKESPLQSRAWCLQEELLSTRRLYYARDQLYWECDHLAVSEDDLADPEFPLSVSASSSLSNIEESELARHASCIWYQHVIECGYSMRAATKATDRLIAVAGLARHVGNTVKSRYLAGLWEVSILQGLLWQTRKDRKSKKEGNRTHCAPSWSWASREARTVWNNIGKRHENFAPGCDNLRAHIDLLSSSDAYGGIKSGTLVLRSKVVEIVVEEVTNGKKRGIAASCQGVRGWVQLDEKMSLSDTRFLAVPVLDDVSLLVTKNLGFDTYLRAGIWTIPFKTHHRRCRPPLDTWDFPEEYLRWTEQMLPTIPVTEIMIV
jgi:hypothetical protein